VNDLILHDRCLGTAYERWHFYRLLDAWADRYGIESVLEGPVDGMAGVPGVHGVGLARRGVPVVAVVPSEEQAAVTRAIYARCGAGGSAEVRVATDAADTSRLPRADLVIAYHALSFVGDWRAHLASVARLAKKLVVVTTCNPDNWGVAILRDVGRLRGIAGLEPPPFWRTDTLAPELWRLGRVREHEYFDCPWWPDLQVSPGQSLLDRARRLVSERAADVEFTQRGGTLADRFVYGAERWPYFGGDGFEDELGPALARHPSFEASPRAWLKRRAAHLHAFAVDVSPRTPQARRRLATVTG
jgi:hypothetical protein